MASSSAYAHYDQWTAHSSAIDSAASSSYIHDDAALTSSPSSRTSGLPSTVSSSAPDLARLPDVTISSLTANNTYSNSCHDAGPVLNQSLSSSTSVNRSSVQSSEPSVPHSPHHVLINNLSTRPRTSNQVFATTTDLAAHYGIPTQLPPLPSIQSRRPVSVTQPSSVPDFNALKANYLSMLSQKPESTPSAPEMSSTTVSPADLQQPLVGDFGELEGLLRSLGNSPLSSPSPPEAHPSPLAHGAAAQPDMSPFEPNEFLTSPWTPSLDTFDSPGETPLSDFLSTPLIPDTDILTDPLLEFESSPLFASLDAFESTSSKPGPTIDASELLTFSPTSPNMGTPALNPSHLISPAMTLENAFPAPPPTTSTSAASPAITDSDASRRRASATGTRKNITVDSLVPIDAPTQSRRYLTPSATSRKEMPAVFARKRQRQQMLDGDEDELECEPLKPNATELEQIEWKRRQNTLAARKSRKRKLQHQQELEQQVSLLREDREKWRQRALTLQGILQANGIPFADFQD